MRSRGNFQVTWLVLFTVVYLSCDSKEQETLTVFPSPSIYLTNTSNGSVFLGNITIPAENVTMNASVSINPNRSSAAVMNTSASIISKITGTTKTENNTFFVEFKTGALEWSPDLTKEYHNNFINSANEIVQIIDSIYKNANMSSSFDGSRVIGFREGGYVSVKLQFNEGDINNLDVIIQFLREGGGDLLTDKVYLKLGKIADCITSYVDTSLCDCLSMSYKRRLTCHQPEIHGGEDCPERCYTGHLIAGYKSCTWDDLDAFKCAASKTKATYIIMSFVLPLYSVTFVN